MKSFGAALLVSLLSSMALGSVCYKTTERVPGLMDRLCYDNYGFETNGQLRQLVLRNFDRRNLNLNVTQFDGAGRVVASGAYINHPGSSCETYMHAEVEIELNLDMSAYGALKNASDLTGVSEVKSFVISGATSNDTCHSRTVEFKAVYTRE